MCGTIGWSGNKESWITVSSIYGMDILCKTIVHMENKVQQNKIYYPTKNGAIFII